MALGSLVMNAHAALTTSSTLEFDPAFTFVAGCALGVINPETGTCTFNGAPVGTELTDISGTFFDFDDSGTFQQGEKTALSMCAPIRIPKNN